MTTPYRIRFLQLRSPAHPLLPNHTEALSRRHRYLNSHTEQPELTCEYFGYASAAASSGLTRQQCPVAPLGPERAGRQASSVKRISSTPASPCTQTPSLVSHCISSLYYFPCTPNPGPASLRPTPPLRHARSLPTPSPAPAAEIICRRPRHCPQPAPPSVSRYSIRPPRRMLTHTLHFPTRCLSRRMVGVTPAVDRVDHYGFPEENRAQAPAACGRDLPAAPLAHAPGYGSAAPRLRLRGTSAKLIGRLCISFLVCWRNTETWN